MVLSLFRKTQKEWKEIFERGHLESSISNPQIVNIPLWNKFQMIIYVFFLLTYEKLSRLCVLNDFLLSGKKVTQHRIT